MTTFWIITQIYGRHEIARHSLASLKATKPAHAQIHIWQDNPDEDCEWAKEFGTLHNLGKNLGIDALRTHQLRKAAAQNIKEIYLTDTDAIHDPNWYPEVKRLHKHAPLAGVYNTRHHSNWKETHSDYHITSAIPGISVYFTGRELNLLRHTLALGTLRQWDFAIPSVLGNRCAISNTSYIEHLGAGGLHNKTWEDDTAISPTQFLIGERLRLLPDLKEKSWQDILETAPPSTVIVNQPHGLGDIIMIEPIVRWIRSLGHQIIWPYHPNFGNLQKHIDYAAMVPWDLLAKYIDSPTPPETPRGSIVLPMRHSHHITGCLYSDVMKSKYDLFGMDWRDWTDAKWIRDFDAEQRLMKQLKIKKGEKFALVNQTFHTTEAGFVKIPEVKGMRNIHLKNIPGFTLIDWSGVFEAATEIHSVGTSLQYVVELADVKADLFMYPRMGEKDCKNYDYLFQKPWKQIL